MMINAKFQNNMQIYECWDKGKIKQASESYDWQLTLRKNLPSLVTVAMSDKPCRSHTTHHILT